MSARQKKNACACGCGGFTAWTYVRGHYRWRGGRSSVRGYALVKVPEHPRANSLGYVLEHILVAERALGKSLPDGAEVHHVNRNKQDNRPENLVIVPDTHYHNYIHTRLTALESCGNPDYRKCRVCKTWDDPANLSIPATKGVGVRAVHRACANEKQRQWKAARVVECRRQDVAA